VQRLEPGLTFGHVRKRLREFAGLSPSYPIANRAGGRRRPHGRPAGGRSETPSGRTHRPGNISCASGIFRRSLLRPLPRRESCERDPLAAPGLPISMTSAVSPCRRAWTDL
jgi:hypothetical protein